VIDYISGNQVTFATPEERKDTSIELGRTQSGIGIRDAIYQTLDRAGALTIKLSFAIVR